MSGQSSTAQEKLEQLRELVTHDGPFSASELVMRVEDILHSPATPPRVVDVVFDGPPDHDMPRFVEVEDERRHSIRLGEWVERDDGYWVLRVEVAP